MKKHIFEPTVLGGIEAKNCIVRSATYEGMAAGGCPNDDMFAMYEALAAGGTGVLVSGWISVAASDHPTHNMVILRDDAAIPSLEKLVSIAHAHGAKMVAQLNHAGAQLFHVPETPVYVPSVVEEQVGSFALQPFTEEQIAVLVGEFGDAAVRAQKAGFDGVQLHCAHGYLFSKWMSPAYNRRTDAYGGNTENNIRIVLEVLADIKKKCGADYPVWVKMNSDDFFPEGVTEEMFITYAKLLEQHGIDAIEVSGGTRDGEHSPCRSKKHAAYHLEAAKRLTGEVDTDVILVGGMRNVSQAEEIMATTDLSGIAMCRPLIREPNLIARWAAGDREDATCVACNGCFNPFGTRCIFSLTDEERAELKEMMKKLRGES